MSPRGKSPSAGTSPSLLSGDQHSAPDQGLASRWPRTKVCSKAQGEERESAGTRPFTWRKCQEKTSLSGWDSGRSSYNLQLYTKTLMVTKEEYWESGTDTSTLLHLKRITNKGLLYSTGNSAQCYAAAWMGGESRGEWTHVYKRLSRFAVHLKLSQHC